MLTQTLPNLSLQVAAASESAPAEKIEAQAAPSWHSPSLTIETAKAPDSAVTGPTQLTANSLWGLTETAVAEKVVDGVYALRGWGIASSYTIEALGGWIIVDTGDSARAAAEMMGGINVVRKAAKHVDLTRPELADFVLGKIVPAKGEGPLAELGSKLDRSHLMPDVNQAPAVIAPTGNTGYTDGMDH